MFDEITDIPEATRETVAPKSSNSFSFLWLGIGGVVLGAIAIAVLLPNLIRPSNKLAEPITEEVITPETVEKTESEANSVAIAETEVEEVETVDNILGHLPYDQVAESALVPVTADGRVSLHKAAATKFKQMQAAARNQGVLLTAISGFRTVDAQDYLFFKVKEQRVQDASKRAEVSAPPGYSEHHTGYAIDIGDGKVPAVDVEPGFENTAAFRWLEENAARYSFELSFPRDNPQGISYEPWHWRFVGDRESLETFYKARNLEIKKAN
ncbi:MAG: M15 family metallopeptidase [Cyanobacteria bacterium P01_F01_bin.143]